MGEEEDRTVMQALLREVGSIKSMQQKSDQKINEKLDGIQASFLPLTQEVSRHSKEIGYLDIERRRKNLIIFGLVESQNESVSDLENKVLELIVRALEVTTFTLMELDFVKRIRSTKQPRPVKLAFTTQRRKFEILKNTGRLKGTNIFIHEDSSPEVREQEKALRGEMMRLRNEGKYAVIRAGRLITREGTSSQANSNIDRTNRAPQNKRVLSESPENIQSKRLNLNVGNGNLMDIQDGSGTQENNSQVLSSQVSNVLEGTQSGPHQSTQALSSFLRPPILSAQNSNSAALLTGNQSSCSPDLYNYFQKVNHKGTDG